MSIKWNNMGKVQHNEWESTRKALKRGLNSVLMDRRIVTLLRDKELGEGKVWFSGWEGTCQTFSMILRLVLSALSIDKRPKYPWSSKVKSSWRASQLMVTEGGMSMGWGPHSIIQYQVKYRLQGKPTFNFLFKCWKSTFSETVPKKTTLLCKIIFFFFLFLTGGV